MQKRKFIFLYLNTGAGHISAAKVLAQAITEENHDIEIKMINGFGKSNFAGKVLFEKGYNFACNYMHGLFPLIYDLGAHRWAQHLTLLVMRYQTKKYLRKVFLTEHPTDVVSFHFALTPYAKAAIRTLPWHVNMTVMVTDPFTVPHAWFYERSCRYFVYSEQAKQTGVHECGVSEKNITVVPFLMKQTFRQKTTPEQIREIRIKRGFDPDKKMVLLLGGGEGLPGAHEIIQKCIFHKADFSVAIVCGRDKAKQESLELLRITYPKLDLHVFGFIDFVDELVKACDCAVIKAGPATLMEVLSCRKPVIICTYIHNQELGNMRYAVDNHVGYYLRRPRDIYRKIKKLLEDNNYSRKMKSNFDSLVIDTDAGKIARLLLESK